VSKYAFLSASLFILFALASCTAQNTPNVPTPLSIDAVAAYTGSPMYDKITPFNLQIEIQNHQLSLHEPYTGSFVGVYIARDTTVNSIRAFEADVGVSHAIFAYTMALDDEYPVKWVLENIALMKTPFIVVMPSENGPKYDIELLTDLAINAGNFDVPIFVNLFPVLAGHAFDPTEYIAFFRRARDIFAEHASNVALVWGFDAESMMHSTQFYPGRDAVDWIHLIIYNDVDTNGQFRDFFAYIDFFYFAFQHEGPLVVSTAVSHYTLESNAYFTRQAAEKITHIYSRLQEYPRIRAILYLNYNDLQGSGNKYAINTMRDISAAYAQALTAPHFLNYVNISPHHEKATIRIHSPFRAIMRNYYFYIPARALIYDTRFPYLQLLDGKEIEIDGDIFFAIADINRVSGADFFVDLGRHLLVLR